MLNTRRSLHAILIILVIFLGIEIIGLFCQSSPPPQINDKNKTYQKNDTAGTPVFMPFINNTTRGLYCIVDWVETNSDAVIALATLAIAWFTFTLYKTSQEHSRHMKDSIAVAQRAAEAAEKSAKALPDIERAYLFVKITMANPKQIAIGTEEKPRLNHNNARVIITNRGKTAGLFINTPYTTKVMNDATIDEHISKNAYCLSSENVIPEVFTQA